MSQISLAVGENLTVSVDYTVTLADLPGPLMNNAVAQPEDPTGLLLINQDDASVSLSIAYL